MCLPSSWRVLKARWGVSDALGGVVRKMSAVAHFFWVRTGDTGDDASLHLIAEKMFFRHTFNRSIMYYLYFLNCLFWLYCKQTALFGESDWKRMEDDVYLWGEVGDAASGVHPQTCAQKGRLFIYVRLQQGRKEICLKHAVALLLRWKMSHADPILSFPWSQASLFCLGDIITSVHLREQLDRGLDIIPDLHHGYCSKYVIIPCLSPIFEPDITLNFISWNNRIIHQPKL